MAASVVLVEDYSLVCQALAALSVLRGGGVAENEREECTRRRENVQRSRPVGRVLA